ncbi:MAG: class I SAM-dependent methyltransferase [Pirellulaceae bacterium]
MNRERDLYGSNGYEVELGFDPLEWLERRLVNQRTIRWLDLCCGSGKALIQAARSLAETGPCPIKITGVDLAGMFLADRPSGVELLQCSVFDYEPAERFDLVTCVHGLHYLGDKLRAIQLAASWLVSDGRFAANLDLTNMHLAKQGQGQRKIVRFLRGQGFEYLSPKHLIRRDGHAEIDVPFRYRGADDLAGPNYTKQPAVDSYYE